MDEIVGSIVAFLVIAAVMISCLAGLIWVFVAGFRHHRMKTDHMNSHGVVELPNEDAVRRAQRWEGFFKGPGANLVVCICIGGLLLGAIVLAGAGGGLDSTARAQQRLASQFQAVGLVGPLPRHEVAKIFPKRVGQWKEKSRGVGYDIGSVWGANSKKEYVFIDKDTNRPSVRVSDINLEISHSIIAAISQDGKIWSQDKYLFGDDCKLKYQIELQHKTGYVLSCNDGYIVKMVVPYPSRIAISAWTNNNNEEEMVNVVRSLDWNRLDALDQSGKYEPMPSKGDQAD